MRMKSINYLRGDVRIAIQPAGNRTKVVHLSMLGSVDPEAGDTRKAEQVVEVVDECILHIRAFCLEVGEPSELTVLNLILVAPVV
jgi:hypothetical protein